MKTSFAFDRALMLGSLALLTALLSACPGGSSTDPRDGGHAPPDSGTNPGDDAGNLGDAGQPPDGGFAGRCNNYSPDRSVFWGDLHSHTEYSLDAAGFGTPTDPFGAYGFAKGQTIQLSPFNGHPRTAKIDRPLDFVAMTDHSEFLGQTKGSGGSKMAAWAKIQDAALQANDATAACAFTSLIAYEWSGKVGNTWIHRNVIFGSDVVPNVAADSVTYPTPQQLWAQLDATCAGLDAGCAALVIPHNANYTMGLQYQVPDTISVDEAKTRARYERVTEVYQHKGSSECQVGVGGTTDPFCQFQQQFVLDCTRDPDQSSGYCKPGSYIRNGLRRGLALEASRGVNPLKMGLVGATDNHNASPGHVDKGTYVGQAGNQDADVLARLDSSQKWAFQSQGGITGVWAEQNDRGNIYQALQRREVYATSGPRIPVRFFGGWTLPADICANGDLASLGYAHGVPMGGDLSAPPTPGQKPTFVVWAQKDPGTTEQPGVGLQRIQIIKGWTDAASGGTLEKVVDVVGMAGDGATVDPATCAVTGGKAALCGTWSDASFDPSEHAFYYARVLEEKSCTVHQLDCNSLPAASRPASCSNGKLEMLAQDRAWSSPIWFSP